MPRTYPDLVDKAAQSNSAQEPCVTRVVVVRQPVPPQQTFWQWVFRRAPVSPPRTKSPTHMMNNNGVLIVPEALVEYVEPAPIDEPTNYALMRGLSSHPFNRHRGDL
jgi:hypothetical protein